MKTKRKIHNILCVYMRFHMIIYAANAHLKTVSFYIEIIMLFNTTINSRVVENLLFSTFFFSFIFSQGFKPKNIINVHYGHFSILWRKKNGLPDHGECFRCYQWS